MRGDFDSIRLSNVALSPFILGVSRKLMTGNLALTAASSPSLFLDPNGVDRDVTLGVPVDGLVRFITNSGSSGNLVLRDQFGVAVSTIAPGQMGVLVSEGASWIAKLTSGGVTLPLHSRLVVEGDSITAGTNGPAYSQFMIARSKGRWYLPSGWQQGVGGQTAAQMATQTLNVTQLNPKVVVYLSGTNDLSGGSNTPAQIFANQRTAVNAYKAAGAVVIFICTLPRGAPNALTAPREADRQALVALQRGQTDVKLVDLEATFNPATMCIDGLHPNYVGAMLIGNAVGDILNTMCRDDSHLDDYLDATNVIRSLNDGPDFAGTGGSKTGTPAPTGNVPTSWTVSHNDAGGALNVVSSIVTMNGRPAVRLQVTGTCDANGRVVNFTNSLAYNGQVGELWESWLEFSLAAGSQGLRSINQTLDTSFMPNNNVTVTYPTDAVSGVMRPPMTTPLAAVDANSTYQCTLYLAAGPVNIDMTWGVPLYRKVVEGEQLALSLANPSADAWCWFHEPRAISAQGKTWFGTTGSNDNSVLTGRASLYQYDHVSGVTTRKEFATSTIAAWWADDHDYPAPLLRPDGRIVAFYAPHRTNGPIKYRVSVAPYSMDAGWSQEYSLGNEAAQPTYPSPVRLSGEGERVYLFYRNGSSSGPLSYVTSDNLATVAGPTVDGGPLGATPTWTAEKQIAQSTGTQGIYHKVASNNVDRIDLLMTNAVGPTAGAKVDVRHAYWQNGQWRTSAGVALGDGSSMIGFTNFTAVATSGAPDNLGDMWCCHIAPRYGTTTIIEAVFWRFVSVSDHRCYYARWNGSAWSKSEVTAGQGVGGNPDTRSTQITDGQGAAEGYYSPGAFFDPVVEGVLFVAVGTASFSQLYRYKTVDAGATWTRTRVSDVGQENVRPVVPLNRSEKCGVLWMKGDYHYFDFNINPLAADIGYTTRIQKADLNRVVYPSAPVNTALPAIAGSTGTAGNVLTASNGTWTGDTPMGFTYQWAKAGVDIAGATNSTYTVQAGDVGASITVKVTATNFMGAVTATSNPASALPTNLVANSGAFNLWTAMSLTVTANVANDSFGNPGADRILEPAATSQHQVTAANINFTSGTTYTFSVYAKAETGRYLQLLFGQAAFGSNAWADYDLQTGVTGTVGSAATASVVDAGGGWYRCTLTAPATGTAAAPVAVYAANAANMTRALGYAGNGTNTWLLADAQVETGNTANTYVPT